MRFSTKLLLLGFLVLLINSAYLISFGEPTLFYIGNVLTPHRPRRCTNRPVHCLRVQAFRWDVDYR